MKNHVPMEYTKRWNCLLIIGIIFLAAIIRLCCYGNLRLSIGTLDTASYISASRSPLFSWEGLSGPRLFTTNLVYRLTVPSGAGPVAISNPRDIYSQTTREIQPGFDALILLQILLSIVGWGFLAWTLAQYLKNIVIKVLTVLLVLLFAFTPQLADWDSILGSESINFSLFALSLGMLMQLVFKWIGKRGFDLNTRVWTLLWLVFFSLWVFARDANLYILPVTILMIIPLIFIKQLRGIPFQLLTITLLIGIFMIGRKTSIESLRWKQPLEGVFEVFIYPYPSRVEYFNRLGMPTTGSAEQAVWFEQHAPDAYSRFLIEHPGFVTNRLFDNIDSFFLENLQPYFKEPIIGIRLILFTLGNILHVRSSVVSLIDVLLLATLLVLSFKLHHFHVIGWAWMSTWLFLSAGVALLVGYFADTIGVMRHVLFAIMVFRLYPLMFLPVVVDMIIARDTLWSKKIAR